MLVHRHLLKNISYIFIFFFPSSIQHLGNMQYGVVLESWERPLVIKIVWRRHSSVSKNILFFSRRFVGSFISVAAFKLCWTKIKIIYVMLEIKYVFFSLFIILLRCVIVDLRKVYVMVTSSTMCVCVCMCLYVCESYGHEIIWWLSVNRYHFSYFSWLLCVQLWHFVVFLFRLVFVYILRNNSKMSKLIINNWATIENQNMILANLQNSTRAVVIRIIGLFQNW